MKGKVHFASLGTDILFLYFLRIEKSRLHFQLAINRLITHDPVLSAMGLLRQLYCPPIGRWRLSAVTQQWLLKRVGFMHNSLVPLVLALLPNFHN